MRALVYAMVALVSNLFRRMAKESSNWGCDRLAGAMANLGYKLSDQTVGNVLLRHGIPPAPERERTKTWTDFIRGYMSVLAGTGFFGRYSRPLADKGVLERHNANSVLNCLSVSAVVAPYEIYSADLRTVTHRNISSPMFAAA